MIIYNLYVDQAVCKQWNIYLITMISVVPIFGNHVQQQETRLEPCHI